MLVKVKKSCYCVSLGRHVKPGEYIYLQHKPVRALYDGMVEAVPSVPVPQNVPDLYPD